MSDPVNIQITATDLASPVFSDVAQAQADLGQAISATSDLASAAAPAYDDMVAGMSSAGTSATDAYGPLDQLAAGMSAAGEAAASSSAQVADLSEAANTGGEAVSGFGSDISELGEKITSGIEDPIGAAKTAVSGFLETLGPAGVGLAAVGTAAAGVAAGLEELASSSAETGEGVLNFSRITGTAVESVGALQYAADVGGSSLDGLQSMLVQVQRRMDATGPAADKFDQALQNLNINAAAFRDMSPEDKIIALSTAMRSGADSTNLMSDGLAIMGRGFMSNMPLLMKDVQDLIDSGQTMGTAWTQGSAEAAENFVTNSNKMSEQFTVMKNAVGNDLIPIFTDFFQMVNGTFSLAMTNASNSAQALSGHLELLPGQVVGFETEAQQATAVANSLAAALNSVKAPIIDLGAIHVPTASEAFKEYDNVIGKLNSDQSVLIATEEAHTKAIQGIIDESTGFDKQLPDIVSAMQTVIDRGNESVEVDNRMANAVNTLKAAQQPIPAWLDTWVAAQNAYNAATSEQARVTVGFSANVVDLGQKIDVTTTGTTNLASAGVVLTTTQTNLGATIGGTVIPAFSTLNLQIPQTKIVMDDANTSTGSWTSGLDGLGSQFKQLATIEGPTFGGLIKDVGSSISQFTLFQKAQDNAQGAFENMQSGAISASEGFATIAGSVATMASSVVSSYQEIGTSTSATVQGFAGLISEGASVGMMFGPYGAAVGAAAGAIVAAWKSLTGPSQAEIDARTQFSTFQTKVAQSFTDLLTSSQLATTGNDSLARTIDEIGDAYALVGKNGVQAETDINAALQATHVSAAAEDAALATINTTLAQAASMTANLTTGMADLNTYVKDGINNQGELSIATDSAVAIFDKEIQSGASVITTLTTMQPALAAIAAGQTTLGVTGDAAITQLMGMSTVTQQFPALMTEIQNTTALLTDMSQTSLLTSKNVIAFGQQAVNQFNLLSGATGNSTEAMAMMQPELQQLWLAQQQFGTLTDSATQALVNQAAQAGIVGPQQESINQQMLNVLTEIGTMIANDTGQAKQFAQAISDIPSNKTVTITTEQDTTSTTVAAWTGGTVTAAGVEHFAGGGYSSRDTIHAMLSPGEVVLNESQQRGVNALLRHGGVTGGSSPALESKLDDLHTTMRGLREDLKFMNATMFTSMRSAMRGARR